MKRKQQFALLGTFILALAESFAPFNFITRVARANPIDEVAVQAVSLAPLSSWILNTNGRKGSSSNATINAVVSQVFSDVRQISYTTTDVYIKTEGIPTYPVGPFNGNPSIPTGRNHTFRITRNPQPAIGTRTSTPLGMIGVHVNGVPFYNALDARSYLNQNIWHQNALFFELAGLDNGPGHPSPDMQMTNGILGGTYHHHSLPSSLLSQLGSLSSTQHSSLIGFAFDGYPIYGPYAFANTNGTGGIARMRSGYQKRNITQRTLLPDGTQLTPSQYGPNVSTQFPVGAYAEDFQYVAGSGDLDEYNGRFAVTPEYPQGTYAYYATIDEQGNGAYPYLIGPRYYGVVTNENNRQTVAIPSAGVTTINASAAAVNAASYASSLSAGAITALFGTNLATATAAATTSPLPTTLGGTSLQLTDNSGATFSCSMFFASPTQINFLVPTQAAAGPALLTVN